MDASHVLRAMKVNDNRARGALRFSFGRFNSESEVDRAIQVVPAVIEKLRALSSSAPAAAPVLAQS